MEADRKSAYRKLVYHAMLEIRPIHWIGFRFRDKLNPFYWMSEIKRTREIGMLADWLHNLAYYSSIDFDRFEEKWFWDEADSLSKKYPQMIQRYKDTFENHLKELNQQTTQTPIQSELDNA